MSQLQIDVDPGSGVNRITLNRPERRNALNSELVAELKESLALADADSRVKVIAIAGAGPDFCAGADLAEVQATVEEGPIASLEDAESLGELFILMRRVSKPIVAIVHGRALAGGCGLASACDLVLAAEDARFGYPEVKLGFVPAMVMAILRRAVGEKHAFELVTRGESITAGRAKEIGLANVVLPPAELEKGSGEYLAALAARSGTAVALTKRLLYATDGVSFESAVRIGAQANALARTTEDCQAGIQRFLEQ
jgi:methylglutaconyl-CoA hydratase